MDGCSMTILVLTRVSTETCLARRLHVAMRASLFVFVLYPHFCITHCDPFSEFIDFIQLRGDQEVVLKTPVFCFGFGFC